MLALYGVKSTALDKVVSVAHVGLWILLEDRMKLGVEDFDSVLATHSAGMRAHSSDVSAVLEVAKGIAYH